MRSSSIFLLASSCLLPLAIGEETSHGEEESKEMGPVAFMWPPDREWGAAQDNTAPCGSSEGVTERTEFPLLHGAIALIIQDDSWNVQVGVSYKENPKSNGDFETLIEPKKIKSLEPGHECYPLPDPPRDIEDKDNATVQIKYTAEFDSDEPETFYACADITYVAASKFDDQIPCFNVTSDEFVSPNPSSTGSSSSKPSEDSDSSDSGSGGLSGGAIAGIVVGAVVGGALLLALAFFGYRRYQRERRIKLHEMSVRNVKWDDTGKSYTSGESRN